MNLPSRHCKASPRWSLLLPILVRDRSSVAPRHEENHEALSRLVLFGFRLLLDTVLGFDCRSSTFLRRQIRRVRRVAPRFRGSASFCPDPAHRHGRQERLARLSGRTGFWSGVGGALSRSRSCATCLETWSGGALVGVALSYLVRGSDPFVPYAMPASRGRRTHM